MSHAHYTSTCNREIFQQLHMGFRFSRKIKEDIDEV
jgi:hypothetical protein